MIRTRRKIVIDRPLAEVFDYLAHFENDMEWRSELLQIQRLTEQAVGPGARYRERISWKGHEGALTLEVTGFEPNRRITYIGEGDARMLGEYRLSGEDGHTRVEVSSEIDFTGALEPIESEVRDAVRKQGEADLAHLKDILEHRQAWRAQSR